MVFTHTLLTSFKSSKIGLTHVGGSALTIQCMYFPACIRFCMCKLPCILHKKGYHHLHHWHICADFLGHSLGWTSYDVTKNPRQQLFLVLVQALEKTSTPHMNGMSHFWQVARTHNPAECNTMSGYTASAECVLAFLGGVHTIFHGLCINSEQLLDFSFSIFIT